MKLVFIFVLKQFHAKLTMQRVLNTEPFHSAFGILLLEAKSGLAISV